MLQYNIVTMALNDYSIPKWRDGDIARKDWTKTRPKPHRENIELYSAMSGISGLQRTWYLPSSSFITHNTH